MKQYKFLVTLVLSISANATEHIDGEGGGNTSTKVVRECFDLGDNSLKAQCVERFYMQSVEELHSTKLEIMGKLKRDIKLFNDTQEKWLAFMKSECAVQSISARAYRDPESQEQLFYKACAAELNQYRVIQLKGIKLNCDSCLQ